LLRQGKEGSESENDDDLDEDLELKAAMDEAKKEI